MISPKGVTVWVGYNSCNSLGDIVSEKENYEKVSKSPSVGTCFCLYEQGIIFTVAFVFLFVFPAEGNLRQGIRFVPLPQRSGTKHVCLRGVSCWFFCHSRTLF